MRFLSCIFKFTGAFLLFALLSPWVYIQQFWARVVLQKEVPPGKHIIQPLYAETLSSLEEGMKSLVPAAETFKQEMQILTDDQMKKIEEEADLTLDSFYDRQYRFHIAKQGSERIGILVDDYVPGKWGAIHYLVLFTPEGKVEDAMVLEYSEKRGRPVAQKRFLKQFFGKGSHDDMQLMKDIRGVTGASISSRGMTNGIRKLVHVYGEFYGEKA